MLVKDPVYSGDKTCQAVEVPPDLVSVNILFITEMAREKERFFSLKSRPKIY
jgi:hypothetical protein